MNLKFLAENPNTNLSYTTFTRLRPFHVVYPNVNQRETTACKAHSNCELLSSKLHQIGVLKSKNINEIVDLIVCSSTDISCMYSTCKKCCNNLSNMYTGIDITEFKDPIEFYQWQTKSENRTSIKGESIEVKINTKSVLHDSVNNICALLESQLRELLPHQYRIYHQFKEIRNLKSKLASDECMLQIDFSQNYECKFGKEIMSVHFGASKSQVALHTCHATLHNVTKCYCTISEDTRHGAGSVWAHLRPVLDDLRKQGIKKIHFISDGPTSQYRNKTNFFLLANTPFTLGFTSLTWNFLECGHGKGPADGIGAAIKNAADRIVAHGGDICSAQDLFEKLDGNINVKLFKISDQAHAEMETHLDDVLSKSYKGTMKIHQILSSNQGSFHHRVLSCFCMGSTQVCDCFNPTSEIVQVLTNNQPILNKIEATLTDRQRQLLKRRLAEGYDITIIDLDALTPEAKNEYLLWKIWKTQAKQKIQLVLHHYYAVLFTRGVKKTFYIGRLIDIDTMEFKFLERTGSRSNYQFDWPRRDDIAKVDEKFILIEVVFEGPPPFFLDKIKLDQIQNRITGSE